MDSENCRKKSKIKIESHGISPWHYHLENMSWCFNRGKQEGDEFLKVDKKKLPNGGRGLEDVLMADFLNILDFTPGCFVNMILEKARENARITEAVKIADNAEIRGNAGNYYIPYDDNRNGVRLAQPDGWIADENTIILLEAKGYRDGAALNEGQLAKEFLVAENVAKMTGHKNFYVMLIVTEAELGEIYKSEKKKLYSLDQNFDDLFKVNLEDLQKKIGEKNFNEILKGSVLSHENTSMEEIKKHFIWITWEEIRNLTENDELSSSSCMQMIRQTISFHKDDKKINIKFSDDIESEKPLFSLMLIEMANKGVYLYELDNGGCGNQILQKYEGIFVNALNKPDAPQKKQWDAWHKLTQQDPHKALLEELCKLEKKRGEAAALLREAKKEIKAFYKNLCKKPSESTRKGFSILGERSNLKNENAPSNFFEQRMQVDPETARLKPSWVDMQIVSVKYIKDFQLKVKFVDGTDKVFDAEEYIKKYHPEDFKKMVEKPEIFKEVQVEETGVSIFWDDLMEIESTYIYKH